jgi:ribosomal protein S18 acetylase RimI-like enzyme
MRIEPYEPRHLDHVVRLAVRAWDPVFASLKEQLAAEVYQAFYPDGWQVSQEKSVQETCNSPDMKLWVAIESGPPVGFVAVRLHKESSLGEIYMIAVDPDHQRKGIAAALSDVALAWMKEAGMSIAMVETAGDPGHGPARGLYARTGFKALPLARYFKKL